MPNSINSAGHSADDDKAARGKFPAETLRHVRAVKSWLPHSYNAEAGQIQNFGSPRT
jgi:hypothetical protein